jgi:hypothetical protein
VIIVQLIFLIDATANAYADAINANYCGAVMNYVIPAVSGEKLFIYANTNSRGGYLGIYSL